MKKKEETQPVGAAEGGRRPTVAAPTGRGGKGRFSSQRKAEAVLRLLRGEELDALSRELGLKFHMNPARIPSPCLGLRGVGVLGF